jgi:hypothetical protein
MTTRPSGSTVALGHWRAKLIGAVSAMTGVAPEMSTTVASALLGVA